jgi:hypothetical protein
VKEIGQSIVLARTAALDDINPKKQTSRYAWASAEEVTGILNGNGGEMTDAVLCQEIAGKYGIAKDLVHKQLSQNDALTFLRPTKGIWKIPVQEHDL